MAEERLQKILARAGVSSRRAAEELILAGRVEVDGKVVRELGTKAEAGRNQIRVDGKGIVEPEADIYFVLYKPERVVTTLSDPEGRANIGDFLRRVDERVFPVGRLDYDAEGVLLLTSDGGLAHKLTHPRWGVKRTYLAKVKGDPTPEALERLVAGVRLDDGKARALEATFERSTEKNTWIRLVVAEGRPHLVKRLCEAVGHPVVRLFRSDYAGITVDGMKPGELRPLLAAEKRLLFKAVEKEAPLPPGGLPRKRVGGTGRGVRDPILGTAPRRAAFGSRVSHGGDGRFGSGAERRDTRFAGRSNAGGRAGGRGGRSGEESPAERHSTRGRAGAPGVRERPNDDWSWNDLGRLDEGRESFGSDQRSRGRASRPEPGTRGRGGVREPFGAPAAPRGSRRERTVGEGGGSRGRPTRERNERNGRPRSGATAPRRPRPR